MVYSPAYSYLLSKNMCMLTSIGISNRFILKLCAYWVVLLTWFVQIFIQKSVCTTVFDKVLVTAVKDLAHTRSEHVYCKLEKAATVRTTVFLSVGVFWFPYSWSVTASNSCSVTAPTRTWRRPQLVLGDGSNSYLVAAPTRTWRPWLQLPIPGRSSSSYLLLLVMGYC